MSKSFAAPALPSSIGLTANPIPTTIESESNSRPSFDFLKLKLKGEEFCERIAERTYNRFAVRYPSQTEIVRVAPEDKLCTTGWPMLADPATGDVYLVSPYLLRRSCAKIWDACIGIGFALAVSHNGQKFLWPYVARFDGDLTAEAAIAEARERWVRISIDKPKRKYHIDPQTWQFPKPRWPKLGHDDVVDIVFGKHSEREICDLDHPVLERIRGKIAA